jgi:predicted SAM-dependent methyltransferase
MLEKLNLGCLNQPAPGWINTDITPHVWIARVPMAASAIHALGRMTAERLREHKMGIFRQVHYLNVTKKFPFPSASITAIYSSHMLEHLYPWDAKKCLAECARILAPQGVLRIAVPDLDQIMSAFEKDLPDSFLNHIYEYGHGMAKNSHRWLYNFSSLSRLLTSLHFATVDRCEYRRGRCPDLTAIEHRPESLFVEAIK